MKDEQPNSEYYHRQHLREAELQAALPCSFSLLPLHVIRPSLPASCHLPYRSDAARGRVEVEREAARCPMTAQDAERGCSA